MARRWLMIEESNAGGCISVRLVGVTAVGMDSVGVAAKGAVAADSGAGRRVADGRHSSSMRKKCAHQSRRAPKIVTEPKFSKNCML
jgi:hypothetical protein